MTRLSPPMASIDDRINEWKRQWEKRVRAEFAEPVKVCNASQRETTSLSLRTTATTGTSI